MSTVSLSPTALENIRQFNELLLQSHQDAELCAKLANRCGNSTSDSTTFHELNRAFSALQASSKELSDRLQLLSIDDIERQKLVAAIKSVHRNCEILFPIVTSLLGRATVETHTPTLGTAEFQKSLAIRTAAISKAHHARSTPITHPPLTSPKRRTRQIWADVYGDARSSLMNFGGEILRSGCPPGIEANLKKVSVIELGDKGVKNADENLPNLTAPRVVDNRTPVVETASIAKPEGDLAGRLKYLKETYKKASDPWMDSRRIILETQAESTAKYEQIMATLEKEKQTATAQLIELREKHSEDVHALEIEQEKLHDRLKTFQKEMNIITTYERLQSRHRTLERRIAELTLKKITRGAELPKEIGALNDELADKQRVLQQAKEPVKAKLGDAASVLRRKIKALRLQVKAKNKRLALLNPVIDALIKQKRNELAEIKVKLHLLSTHYEAAKKTRDARITADDLERALLAIDKDLSENLPSRFAIDEKELNRRLSELQNEIQEQEQMHGANMQELNKLLDESQQEIADLTRNYSTAVEKLHKQYASAKSA